MEPALPPRAPFLRDYQVVVLRNLLLGVARCRGETFTVMFPRQAGKNETAAVLVAALLRMHAAEGGTIVVCAPTAVPQARISLQRARAALATTDRLFPEAGHARTTPAGLAVGRAEAIFLGASPRAHVAGHTASIGLIADEAQDINADWFNRQFRPMAASTGAPTVMFGTAWDGHSLLETAAARNRQRPLCHGVPLHQQVRWEDVAATVPAYGDYVRSERARLGAHHPLFLSQYELVASDGAGRLLTGAQLAALEGTHARLRGPQPGDRYVAGLDFGGEGRDADATVLTVARVRDETAELVDVVAWRGAPYASVLADVRGLARAWGFERVSADATGMGAPLVAQLHEDLGEVVEGVVFTAASKSELGYALIAAAETRRLQLFVDDGSTEAACLRRELRECRARFASGGRLQWGNDAAHDDFVASLALCLRAATALGPRRVAMGRRAR